MIVNVLVAFHECGIARDEEIHSGVALSMLYETGGSTQSGH